MIFIRLLTISRVIKVLFLTGLISLVGNTIAECNSFPKLEGSISVEPCDANKEKCISAINALRNNLNMIEHDETDISVALFASPWRFYNGDMRIMTTEEVAEQIKPSITKETKTVSLIASWSGVAPEPNKKSLAQKLSVLLEGVSVRGPDGFLWINKDGKLKITHQAFTVRMGGPYVVAEGGEVMISMVAGWYATSEQAFIEKKMAEGILRAGAGWDIFLLCPERALKSFEAAAKLDHPIAAYNAALIRLERDEQNDFEAAIKLLSKAEKLGDEPAKNKLESLNRKISLDK